MNNPSDDERLYSRSGNSTPFGKCDERIDVPVPADTKDAITALAYSQGVTVAEYVRNLLFTHVHGHAVMLRKRNIG